MNACLIPPRHQPAHQTSGWPFRWRTTQSWLPLINHHEHAACSEHDVTQQLTANSDSMMAPVFLKKLDNALLHQPLTVIFSHPLPLSHTYSRLGDGTQKGWFRWAHEVKTTRLEKSSWLEHSWIYVVKKLKLRWLLEVTELFECEALGHIHGFDS